jgi:methyl-accepting chemotaxis protein
MIDRQMTDMKEVSAIVNTVVASLRPILSELQPIMQNTSSIAIESKAAATQLRSVSDSFKSVFDQTLELPKAVNAVNRDFNQTLSEQARMLAQNQASFKDLGETVGSGVSSALSVVRAGFEHSKNEIQHGQTQLAQNFGSKIESLSDSMEELNGSINKIVSLVKN